MLARVFISLSLSPSRYAAIFASRGLRNPCRRVDAAVERTRIGRTPLSRRYPAGMDQSLDLTQLAAYLREFSAEREWEQFHTPKNLAMALSGEVGELVEVFQWLTPEESASLDEAARKHTSDELADVTIYLVRLADVLGIDLGDAVRNKMQANEARYTVEVSRGSAEKR
jgi:NTP pyrophosphatase (non-canonical NTP hydrolase)